MFFSSACSSSSSSSDVVGDFNFGHASSSDSLSSSSSSPSISINLLRRYAPLPSGALDSPVDFLLVSRRSLFNGDPGVFEAFGWLPSDPTGSKFPDVPAPEFDTFPDEEDVLTIPRTNDVARDLIPGFPPPLVFCSDTGDILGLPWLDSGGDFAWMVDDVCDRCKTRGGLLSTGSCGAVGESGVGSVTSIIGVDPL